MHRHTPLLPRLSPLSRPLPPRAHCRRVHSRVYNHRVIAKLVAVVAIAAAPRSLPPQACQCQCAVTLSFVPPPRQQSPCARAATSGIGAPPRALADAVAPPHLALLRYRVRSRCVVDALPRPTRRSRTADHDQVQRPPRPSRVMTAPVPMTAPGLRRARRQPRPRRGPSLQEQAWFRRPECCPIVPALSFILRFCASERKKWSYLFK